MFLVQWNAPPRGLPRFRHCLTREQADRLIANLATSGIFAWLAGTPKQEITHA